jgi:hypothetical protein
VAGEASPSHARSNALLGVGDGNPGPKGTRSVAA